MVILLGSRRRAVEDYTLVTHQVEFSFLLIDISTAAQQAQPLSISRTKDYEAVFYNK